MHPVTKGAVALALAFAAAFSTSSAPEATFTEIYTALWPITTRAQCNFCHGLPPNQTSNGLLSMGSDQATAYAALMATSTSTACGGKKYVVPGDPDSSLLVSKLSTPTCGNRMPLGGTELTADQLDQVRSWIEAGAKDN